MRLPFVLLVVLLAGCVSLPPRDAAVDRALDACRTAPTMDHTLFFGAGGRLITSMPPAGSAPGNAFSSAFLTDDLRGWLSDPVPAGLWIVGNVTLSFWARSTGTPAPALSASGSTQGQGYRFFNQFGSDRSLQPAYATEYGPPYVPEGTVTHYEERLAMPYGDFVVEAGQRVRVLLTDLALDGADGAGHDILFGEGTPSQVRFTARCYPDFAWSSTSEQDRNVALPANQGAISHLVPATKGINQVRTDVDVPANTDRLTITLQQTSDPNPLKDDVDITLLDGNGTAVWSIASPYANESGTLWRDNLRLFNGHMTIVVDSYSAVEYQGRLSVVAETAHLPA